MDKEFIESCRRRSRESQEVKFPYFVDLYGMRFQVNEHVFSPIHCSSYKFFIPRLPDVTGQEVLEIGSGHGVVACYLARKTRRVVATDINPFAVENTATNAKLNGFENLEAIQSDVFDNVSGKYDLIFWNLPWGFVPEGYLENILPEEKGMFDPGYRAISKYLLEGKDYLKPNGSLLLGFGHSGANIQLIEDLVARSGLRLKRKQSGRYAPGENDSHGNPIEMEIELWELGF